MFTLWSNRHKTFCDGLSRRNFLQVGAFGAGLSLADLLRAQSASAASTTAARARVERKARSAIMIYLPGGPSHIDMYDPKPEAPVEFRGEFSAIPTNVAGIRICELMPLQARMMDKLSIVRSLVANEEHSDSYLMTGFTEGVNRAAGQGQHPSFGAVLSKLWSGPVDTPPFVSLRGMTLGTEPGFLGVAHRPFTPDGPGLQNLRLPKKVDAERLSERKDLLGQFDTIRREIDATGTMKGIDTFTSRAFDMIASGAVRTALNLKLEDPRVRDRYKGVEQFLTARRLVEAGVGCVTLSYGGWDTHSSNFKQLRQQLPALDRGIATLIGDLHERGMEDEVVTVVWGEFGRTPKVNTSDGGRDHWSPVMSALVAGGGLKMGQTVGTTSARAELPKDRPYKVPQLLSTIYRAMGIDPVTTFPNGSGRPIYLLDDREPVTELL
jgi:Protein of unknown function (DUF1501)